MKKQFQIPLKLFIKLLQVVIHFFLNLFNKTFNKIERPENQTKKLNLVSVQNKMELTTLNNFLKSKK